MDTQKLNTLADYLVSIFEEKKELKNERGVKVNALVSEIASLYEKMRNAVEYRDDEAVLRAAIQRILKRRLILGNHGKENRTVAMYLVRELVWARYFPDGSIVIETVEHIQKLIDAYLALQKAVSAQRKINSTALSEFIYHVMSSHIEKILNPGEEKEAMVNFMYHVLHQNVVIADDSEETRDVQVFIAIRKAFAKNDLALLRFHLFSQYFGNIEEESIEKIAERFVEGYKNIEGQLKYPIQHKIFSYIKRLTPPFLVLYEILQREKDNSRKQLTDPESLDTSIRAICKEKYNNIISKVHRAIVRSVIFILFSKVVIALAVEGTYESIIYGSVMWFSIGLNVIIPPILMALSALFIRTPGEKNTQAIENAIKTVLFTENPSIGFKTQFKKAPNRSNTFLYTIFTLLWLATFGLSFGLIIYLLHLLHFNIASQAVFIFFLAIVMFLIHRIRQTALEYTVLENQGFQETIFNFFFMPFASVGRKLAEGVAQVNIFLFVLDFLIETPFKAMVGFFDDWFFFLNEKREELG